MEKIIDLFGEKVKGKNGDVAVKDLCGEKKLIGVYFSAHWCPPCRAFTPHLAKKYQTWKKAGHPFEIIFVSSDRDQSSFDDYYKEMPWLTVPYDDEERRNKLSETFEVQGIPTLSIVCGKTGTVISEDASEDVGESDEFPKTWNTDPVNIKDCDLDGELSPWHSYRTTSSYIHYLLLHYLQVPKMKDISLALL